MGMDVSVSIYIGVEVTKEDFFTHGNFSLDCSCSEKGKGKFCSDCGQKKGLSEMRWVPKYPEFVRDVPYEDKDFDECLDWESDFWEHEHLWELKFCDGAKDSVILLGLRMGDFDTCIRGGNYHPFASRLPDLTKQFVEVYELCKRFSLEDRKIELRVESYISV